MKSIKVITAHGLIETWPARTDSEWVFLASELYPQWLIDRGLDPDQITLDQAIEALTHDCHSFELIDSD